MKPLVIKKSSQLIAREGNEEWLITDLLPRNSLALVSAEPKQGKTMFALDLITSFCSGTKALGQFNSVNKGTGLYIALEDTESILKNRIDGFMSAKSIPKDTMELYTVTDQLLLIDTNEGKNTLIRAIESSRPELLVLDNLSRIHTSNENNATQMGILFEFLQELKRTYGVTIVVVCHTGKAENGPRGSSQINSYYEAGFFLKNRNGQKYIDRIYRGYPSVKDTPYSIVSDNGAMRFVLGEESKEISMENEPVYIETKDYIMRVK